MGVSLNRARTEQTVSRGTSSGGRGRPDRLTADTPTRRHADVAYPPPHAIAESATHVRKSLTGPARTGHHACYRYQVFDTEHFPISVGSDDGIVVVPRELRQEVRLVEELLKEIRQEMRDGFAGVNGRLDKLEGRVERVEGRLGRLEGQVSTNEATLNRVDAEVHRQGLLIEERHEELRLAIEAFQTAQRVTNAKIDLLRDATENRLVPLELATRSHATTLADHGRRLDQAEGRTTG